MQTAIMNPQSFARAINAGHLYFSGVEISGASVKGRVFDNVFLENVIIRGGDFQQTLWRNCQWHNSAIYGGNFTRSQFFGGSWMNLVTNSNFSHVGITNVRMHNIDMEVAYEQWAIVAENFRNKIFPMVGVHRNNREYVAVIAEQLPLLLIGAAMTEPLLQWGEVAHLLMSATQRALLFISLPGKLHTDFLSALTPDEIAELLSARDAICEKYLYRT